MSENPEKRSVHTDALATLGTIIGEGEKRDAIHLAVEPTVAAEKLYPGQDVGVDGTRNNPVGIVDPFLKSPVMPGDRFWLVVYPRQITSLRHVWSHPSFPTEVPQPDPPTDEQRKYSEDWLRSFSQNGNCPDYELLLAAAAEVPAPEHPTYGIVYEKDGDYLHFNGHDASGEIPPEFWNHVEIVTGKKITKRPEFFSCSC
jgi:hypothetical protein